MFGEICLLSNLQLERQLESDHSSERISCKMHRSRRLNRTNQLEIVGGESRNRSVRDVGGALQSVDGPAEQGGKRTKACHSSLDRVNHEQVLHPLCLVHLDERLSWHQLSQVKPLELRRGIR